MASGVAEVPTSDLEEGAEVMVAVVMQVAMRTYQCMVVAKEAAATKSCL